MHWGVELLRYLMHLAPHPSTFALEEVSHLHGEIVWQRVVYKNEGLSLFVHQQNKSTTEFRISMLISLTQNIELASVRVFNNCPSSHRCQSRRGIGLYTRYHSFKGSVTRLDS